METIAKINGYNISVMEYREELRKIMWDEDLTDPDFDCKIRAVEHLIDAGLLLFQALKEGIKIERDDIEHEFLDFMLQFESEEEFNAMLNERHLTMDEVREHIEKKMLINRYVKNLCQDHPSEIREERLWEFYRENKEKFVTQETVHAYHILFLPRTKNSLGSAQSARDKMWDKKSFMELGNKLECNDIQFADLGFFSRGETVEEFEDVAFNLKPGEISLPFETCYGWHIVYVEEHKPSSLACFDKIKESLKTRLCEIDRELIILKKIKTLRQEAAIEVYEEYM